jgi:hypothetical protein
MTRPRMTYEYAAQVVCEGPWRLEARGHSLELFKAGEPLWRHSTAGSTQQAFVSDDGRAAVLDAADHLTFREPTGRVMAEGSLLDLACPGWRRDREGGSPVRSSTAGPKWERFLAATFLPASESADFVVCGRGVEPFSLNPASMARTDTAPNQLRDLLRTRAPEVLRRALDALRSQTPGTGLHGEPWRFAAVGWARVAGAVDAQEAAPILTSLASLALCVDGVTTLLRCPCPKDDIDVRRGPTLHGPSASSGAGQARRRWWRSPPFPRHRWTAASREARSRRAARREAGRRQQGVELTRPGARPPERGRDARPARQMIRNRSSFFTVASLPAYGGYLMGRSSTFRVGARMTLLKWVNVSKVRLPWYAPMPLLPTPPNGR